MTMAVAKTVLTATRSLKVKYSWVMKLIHVKEDLGPSGAFIHDTHHVKFISGGLANTCHSGLAKVSP